MRELKRAVKRLRGQADAALHKHRAMSAGAKVEVDYFALIDLIEYYDETKEAAGRLVKVRELLDGVMFRRNP